MRAPTAWDVRQVLIETPGTVFVTVTRKAATQLNTWAVEALFAGVQPLTHLPVEPDDKAEERPADWQPPYIPVYRGMRMTLTKNLNKKTGFVNGMGATVIEMCRKGVMVRTDQGRSA